MYRIARTTAIAQRPTGIDARRDIVGVLRDSAIVAFAGAAIAAVAAGLVVALDAGEAVREWYGLTPERPVQAGVGELWVHNARALLPAFGAAAAVAWWPRARPVLDVALIVMFALNILLVAVALGAYGAPLWRLGPGHYPLELLAVATATAAYLDARRRGRVRPAVAGLCAGLTILVLLLAAVLESAGA